MPRIPFNPYFMGIAKAVSVRGDCIRKQVGAVLVDPHRRIIGTGYNGSPSGHPGCLDDGACPRALSDLPPHSPYDTCISVHAEVNALLYSTRDTRGSSLYTTYEPCPGCTKLIRQAGVAYVQWPGGSWHG